MSKAKSKRIVISILKYITLVFGAFVSVLPIVVCVITAFKTPEEYASTNVMTLPESWVYFENFIQAWSQANMGIAFRNSIIILVCVLTGSILTGSMLAYVLSRFTCSCSRRCFRVLPCRCRYIRSCTVSGGLTFCRVTLS